MTDTTNTTTGFQLSTIECPACKKQAVILIDFDGTGGKCYDCTFGKEWKE